MSHTNIGGVLILCLIATRIKGMSISRSNNGIDDNKLRLAICILHHAHIRARTSAYCICSRRTERPITDTELARRHLQADDRLNGKQPVRKSETGPI